MTDPTPGTYTVYVHAASAEDGSTVAGALQTWVVPGSGAAPVTLSTDAVGFAPGQRFRYSASWVGLDPATSYLGVLTYGDTAARTLLAVN